MTTAAGARTLAVGEPLAGTEQQWIVAGDDALLVDAWVVRALVPDRLALRARQPLAGASSAASIRIVRTGTELKLAGTPRMLGGRLVARELADTVERVLADLAIARIAPAPAGPRGLRIELAGGAWLEEAGACAGGPGVAVATSDGDACVTADAWALVTSAVDALAAPPGETVDRRPLPVEIRAVTLPDGSRLDLAKRPRIDGHDADPARVAELLAVLAAPAEIAPMPAPTTPPRQLVVEDAAGGKRILELLGGGLVARPGEGVALQVGDGAVALLARPGRAYRDPAVWAEDPSTISSLSIDATTYTRGAALGEWTRGAGSSDAAAVTQLVEQLARLRAIDPTADAPAIGPSGRRLTIAITPPGGARRMQTLTVADGPCRATTEGPAFLVAPDLCKLVDRLR